MQHTGLNINPGNWLNLYADKLYSYAMSKTSNDQLAEDLVQETFLSGLSSIQSFKGNSTEQTWLFAILKKKIADYYRKASTRYETKLIGETGEPFLNNFFDDYGAWKPESKPTEWIADSDTKLEDKEFKKTLAGCIEKLPQNWNTLITLKYLIEKESDEICKELNITPTNYWVMIHRAKLQLRACIEKNWFTR